MIPVMLSVRIKKVPRRPGKGVPAPQKPMSAKDSNCPLFFAQPSEIPWTTPDLCARAGCGFVILAVHTADRVVTHDGLLLGLWICTKSYAIKSDVPFSPIAESVVSGTCMA